MKGVPIALMHYPRVYYIYELFVEDMFRWFQHLQIVWKILTGQSRVNGRENCESSCQQLLKEDEEAQRTISEKEIRVQFSARYDYERSKIFTIYAITTRLATGKLPVFFCSLLAFETCWPAGAEQAPNVVAVM